MTKNENNSPHEMKSDAFNQKEKILQEADRMLSIIKNINRQGGITTQLQIAAACIELQHLDWYLYDTYYLKMINRDDFPDLLKLEKYIRSFRNVEQDFWNDRFGGHHNPKQREEDIEAISHLQEDVMLNNERLSKYDEEYLDSWKEIKTDIEMLSEIFSYLIRITIAEFDSIYQEIRGLKANTISRKRNIRNNFREFVLKKEQTEEIIRKLHRLIDNKVNTAAIRIINEAMWIDLISLPTAPSVKEEFPNITCDDSYVNRILDLQKPVKNGKVDEEKLNKIREKFEKE